jgi:glycosyltransferase involved in cell wall biosynthesis
MALRIAYVSTYPPRRCGIATFTCDLIEAVGSGEVVAIHSAGDSHHYPVEVRGRVNRDDRDDYRRAAERIVARGVDLVSIQHEYGIFGGADGSYLLDLVDCLTVPTVITFHSVLRRPTSSQRAVLARLSAKTSASVVMSDGAAELLRSEYGGEPSKIQVIHHGTPDLPAFDSARRKRDLGMAGRTVILSFGLLGPGKGYEHMIRAIAKVRNQHPEALYVVLGATHPQVLRNEGERYRLSLAAQVEELGLRENVKFVDRFVSQEELGRWLQAADIFTTPYPNLDQAVSGTLSYAVAAGKAILSTPYAYACELLADGRGMVVQPDSVSALANGLESLLANEALRADMGRRAYAFGRRMVWHHVGSAYRDLFAQVSRTPRIVLGSTAGRGPSGSLGRARVEARPVGALLANRG